MLRVLSVVQAIYVTLSEKSQVFDVHIFMNDQFAKLVTRNGVLFGLVSLVTLVALLFDKFKDVHMLIAKEDERLVVLCGQSCVEPAVHLFSERFRWRELLDHLWSDVAIGFSKLPDLERAKPRVHNDELRAFCSREIGHNLWVNLNFHVRLIVHHTIHEDWEVCGVIVGLWNGEESARVMFIQDMVHDLAISPFSRGLLYGNIGVVDHALDDGTVLHENTDVLFLRLTRLTLDLEDRDHLIVQVFAISDSLVLHELLLNDVIGGEDVLVGEEYQVLVH